MRVSHLALADGKAAWTYVYSSAKASSEARDVAETDQGGAVAVGSQLLGATSEADAAVWGVTHDGKASYLVKFDGGHSDVFRSVARLSTGAMVAVGQAYLNSSSRYLFLVGFNAKTGAKLWQREASSPPDLSEPRMVLSEPQGGAIVAGNVVVKGRRLMFLKRIDDAGACVEARTRHQLQAGRRHGGQRAGHVVGRACARRRDHEERHSQGFARDHQDGPRRPRHMQWRWRVRFQEAQHFNAKTHMLMGWLHTGSGSVA